MVILLSADHKNVDLQVVLISFATFMFQFRLNCLYRQSESMFQIGDFWFCAVNCPSLSRQIRVGMVS